MNPKATLIRPTGCPRFGDHLYHGLHEILNGYKGDAKTVSKYYDAVIRRADWQANRIMRAAGQNGERMKIYVDDNGTVWPVSDEPMIPTPDQACVQDSN